MSLLPPVAGPSGHGLPSIPKSETIYSTLDLLLTLRGARDSFEMLLRVYETIRRHIPGASTLHSQHRESFESRVCHCIYGHAEQNNF
jgi:hypothetical protein